MAAQFFLSISLLSIFISNLSLLVSSTTFTILNKCDHTVWPGILSNGGIPPLSTTGFSLHKGESKTIAAPFSWGGRFWGRTLCDEDSDGKFACVTGDCGSVNMECSGGATPPATLAEFKLNGDGGLDFYDVSLVDGYNLPMLVVPRGGSGVNCTSTGCVEDLIGVCPNELKVTSADGGRVACKSACGAFATEEYCCSGAYDSPNKCKPSMYSRVFKNECPQAYSYAYDDRTSTFTCAGADYLITFCPSPRASLKSSSSAVDGENSAGGQGNNVPPWMNSTMVYEGAFEINSASPSLSVSFFRSPAIAITIIMEAMWQLFHHL